MKHKLFSKRGLALVVSVMMCLSAMSTTAWAGSFKDLQKEIDNAGDSYTLTDNYTYEGESDNATISINKDITLNLNGWTISGKVDGQDVYSNSVITVERDKTLTLKDEKVETDTIKSNKDKADGTITGGKGSLGGDNRTTEGGGVIVRGNGTFVMESGTIKDNHTTGRAGGVYVENDATFKMTGGTITENSTNGEGGGVSVWGTGKFEMTGGTISANNANNGGGVYTHYASGKGTGGTFTMSGGTISDNTADRSGGGVYAGEKSNFTMSGNSSISSNSSKKAVSYGDECYGGGGVFVDKGNFTMSGGEIGNNTSGTDDGQDGASGGGVYVNGGKFTMGGGTISGNTARINGEGGGIYGRNNATIEMTNGKITNNTANSIWGGGGVRVYEGAQFTMNGGELTGNHAPNIGDKTDRISVSKDANNGKPGSAVIYAGTIEGNAKEYLEGKCYTVDLDTVGDSAQFTVYTDHDWTEATCKHAKTCKNCGKTDGQPTDRNAHGHFPVPRRGRRPHSFASRRFQRFAKN